MEPRFGTADRSALWDEASRRRPAKSHFATHATDEVTTGTPSPARCPTPSAPADCPVNGAIAAPAHPPPDHVPQSAAWRDLEMELDLDSYASPTPPVTLKMDAKHDPWQLSSFPEPVTPADSPTARTQWRHHTFQAAPPAPLGPSAAPSPDCSPDRGSPRQAPSHPPEQP